MVQPLREARKDPLDGWQEKHLGQLVEAAGGSIRTGPFGSQLHAREYTDDPHDVPVVMPKDMVGGRVNRSSVSRVSEDTADRLHVHRLEPGDVVLARRGDVGRYVSVQEDERGWLCGTGCMRIHIPSRDLISPEFLRYALANPAVREWLVGHAVGATMPNLNGQIVENIPLRIPGVRTQRRVAALLAAIDELIEINERRIELLEDLTRSLYREWFVRFRFPGHEDAAFYGSDVASIPEGWVAGAVGDFLEVIGGGTPSKTRDEFWVDGTIDWFTPSDLTRIRKRFVDESTTRITKLGLDNSSARVFPAGSVLMTSRATLGVLAVASHDATCNQGFIVIPPVADVPPIFLYEWLANNKDQLEMIASGATFKEITKGAFKRFAFVRPASDVLEQFATITVPIGDAIASYECINRQLASTRDLLLPRLVTGQLDISDIDLGDLLPVEAA